MVSSNSKFCKHCGYNLSAKTPPIVAVDAPKNNDTLHNKSPSIIEKPSVTQSRTEGERKRVTALFTDIVGSTALAEQIDPEDWRDIVSGAHQRVSDAIYRYEGTIAQLLGDGVLAFFGAPIAHEDDAERAIRSALSILDEIKIYADELRMTHRVPNFQMRIGLNTGLVVVGNVGSNLHMEYLAIGDTVNLAARVQSIAKPDTIFITHSTQRLVTPLFEFEDFGKIALKGKADLVQIYRVVGEHKTALRTRGIAGLTSSMVGRQRELMMLSQVGADAREGRGAIVSIVAEAGLGKSRLIAEWRKKLLDAMPSVCWVEGRCLSFTTSIAHHLSIEIIRAIINVNANMGESQATHALKSTLDELIDDPAVLNDVYVSISHLLGFRVSDEAEAQFKYMDRATIQARLVTAFRHLLAAQANKTPTILICEDIHWADPSSVELITALMPVVRETPLVFVFNTRPDSDSAGWRLVENSRSLGVGAVELHLAPLNERDSDLLLANLLNINDLPDEIRLRILAKSEGNPFFVEEVIRMLIERNAIMQREGNWHMVSDIKTIEIPDTLQGVLTSRIDRLPTDTKRLLQIASVIGRRFSVNILEQVLERMLVKV
jgi:class 3 adenylate cyclase